MVFPKHPIAVLGLGMLAAATPVAAFTFSDGTSGTCIARGAKVAEYEAPPDEPLVQGRAGLAVLDAKKEYLIVWNPERLKVLPPEVRDFLFFHECAHARVPTEDEVVANCNGLKDMRAAGRAGVALETRLAAFYGAGNSYWRATLACANAGPAK